MPRPAKPLPLKSVPTSKKSSGESAATRNGLKKISAALEVAALAGYSRLTVPQLLFFLKVAEYDLAGKVIRFTDIEESLGEAIGRSLHTTYKTLLAPRGRTNAGGVGWLQTETNPNDLRERFLGLTPLGADLARAITDALDC
jgi:hypothetical protein